MDYRYANTKFDRPIILLQAEALQLTSTDDVESGHNGANSGPCLSECHQVLGFQVFADEK
jgi:hypothetical protein